MALRERVFRSLAEQELYQAIRSQWCQQGYGLWHGLHFGNIFDMDTLDLNARERRMMSQSEVDFTLCTKKGRPLLSIEFDGMGLGFSRMGRYVQEGHAGSPLRKEKLEIKLKVAAQHHYPFFVISYREKRQERQRVKLTVVDGIIGEALTHLQLRSTVPRTVSEHEEHASSLPDDLRDEYMEDLVVTQEVFARMRFNPIAREISRLENLLWESGISFGKGGEPLHDPAWKPRGTIVFDGQELPLYDTKDMNQIGWTASIQINETLFRETVWVRNFDGSGVYPGTIAQDIATLFALKRAVARHASHS